MTPLRSSTTNTKSSIVASFRSNKTFTDADGARCNIQQMAQGILACIATTPKVAGTKEISSSRTY